MQEVVVHRSPQSAGPADDGEPISDQAIKPRRAVIVDFGYGSA
jgi:hypothetical protein